MKNIAKSLYVASGLAITAMLSGCVSAPGTYPTVPGSDDVLLSQETKEAIERAKSEHKFRIAIVPERALYANKLVQKYDVNKIVGDQVEALCSGLSMFELIARQELHILSAEDAIKNLASPNAAITLPKPVDALLVYSITSCGIDSRQGYKYDRIGGSSKRREITETSGRVTLKVTLINTKNQKKLFTKTFSGKTDWDEGEESAQLLVDASGKALEQFIKDFAYDFAPVGYVIQTTGNGRWAKITLGSGSGINFQTKVEFIEKDANGLWRPYAYGEVREPNYDFSWVLVNDFENARIRNNARVKVSANQSRTFGEAISGIFVYGK